MKKKWFVCKTPILIKYFSWSGISGIRVPTDRICPVVQRPPLHGISEGVSAIGGGILLTPSTSASLMVNQMTPDESWQLSPLYDLIIFWPKKWQILTVKFNGPSENDSIEIHRFIFKDWTKFMVKIISIVKIVKKGRCREQLVENHMAARLSTLQSADCTPPPWTSPASSKKLILPQNWNYPWWRGAGGSAENSYLLSLKPFKCMWICVIRRIFKDRKG